jgi:hypothetical protein
MTIDLSFIKKGDDLQKFVEETDWVYSADSYGGQSEYSLSSYQKELNDAIGLIDDELDRLRRSKAYFDKYEISYSYDDYVQKVFELTELKNKLFIDRVEFNSAVDRKRKSCEHDLKYTGHDHSHDYYFCKKCGYEERV